MACREGPQPDCAWTGAERFIPHSYGGTLRFVLPVAGPPHPAPDPWGCEAQGSASVPTWDPDTLSPEGLDRCLWASRGCEGWCRSQSSIAALGGGGHNHCVLHQLLVQQGTGGSTHPDLPQRTRASHCSLTLGPSVSLRLCSQGAGVLSVPRKTRIDGEALEKASQEG